MEAFDCFAIKRISSVLGRSLLLLFEVFVVIQMKNMQVLLFENGMGYVAVRTIAFGGHSWFIANMKW